MCQFIYPNATASGIFTSLRDYGPYQLGIFRFFFFYQYDPVISKVFFRRKPKTLLPKTASRDCNGWTVVIYYDSLPQEKREGYGYRNYLPTHTSVVTYSLCNWLTMTVIHHAFLLFKTFRSSLTIVAKDLVASLPKRRGPLI